MKRKLLRNSIFVVLVFSLASCSALGGSTPQPLPTIILGDGDTTPAPGSTTAPQNRGSGVTASGIVAPAQEAQLVSALAGKIQTVMVSVGDRVTAGQPLVVLEGQEDLEAAISATQFELVQAQQALADLTKQAETERVHALQDIITFERAVRDAQYALDNFTIPSNQASMDTVEALNQMKLRLDQARLAFEPYKYRPSSDSIREDMKEALDLAQADYNSAVKRLQYEYDLEVAEAQLAKALADYEILKAGPNPDKVQLAEARLANAQTQLAAAQAALEDLTLTAPFDSTVSMINKNSGEWVIPGETILVLLDLDHLRIETTDLSERDIPGIEIGQPVTAFIEALQQEVSGQVSEIAPLADTLGGDVVYKTVIELDSQISGLRAGMSVEVQFGR
jgi:multidrug efflux pump subunit AcrA (membrane-fusion protein)